jgi:hypothetical protein
MEDIEVGQKSGRTGGAGLYVISYDKDHWRALDTAMNYYVT